MSNRQNILPTHTQYCFFLPLSAHVPTDAFLFTFYLLFSASFFQPTDRWGWSETKQPSYCLFPYSSQTLNFCCTSRSNTETKTSPFSFVGPWNTPWFEEQRTVRKWEKEKQRGTQRITETPCRVGHPSRIEGLGVFQSWNLQYLWVPLLACCWSWCAAPCWALSSLPAATRPVIMDTHTWETLTQSNAWGTTLWRPSHTRYTSATPR